MQDKGISGGVGASETHDSAELHVTGTAYYTDDIPMPGAMLFAAIGGSQYARARIKAIDLQAVSEASGVVAVISAKDIPGENQLSFIQPDEPVFAEAQVEYVGQPIFAVAAKTSREAQAAVKLAVIEYQPLPPVLTIDQARVEDVKVSANREMQVGDVDHAIVTAEHQLQGQLRVGGQEHFYLEGQVAVAVPQDDSGFMIHSSTQYPAHIQKAVSRTLGLSRNSDVVVTCRRLGGAFGGKETQAALFACVVALLAQQTGRTVKVRPSREQDMQLTGKRHDFLADYQVGFDATGRIAGYRLSLASRCGMALDLSASINDRAMLHSDNCYFFPAVSIVSQRFKTNTPSNTAFRGFGGPQGIWVIEQVLDAIAHYLGKDPLDVRYLNFYTDSPRNLTPYAMPVLNNQLPVLVPRLEAKANYRQRRIEITEFNRGSPVLKRGIVLTPVKFGISFTQKYLNQAGALLHVYEDGSVYLNHGGTEMGQGLFTKVAQVVAQELQIDLDRITISATDTSKVPNASATAASASTDLNGKAALLAARTIKQRLQHFAAEHFDVAKEEVMFDNNAVVIGKQTLTFKQLVALAYQQRISLSSTGFYRTPLIHFDRNTFQGRPFLYFAYGAAVSEVIVDTLTGESKLLRVDILHDCGRSLNPAIDKGQIEGGFMQGMGWLTMEELLWNERGELQTDNAANYKIPTSSDCPSKFNVDLLDPSGELPETLYSSKAVGEPPLMLAISVFQAIKDAIKSIAKDDCSPELDAPATPERILLAIESLRDKQTIRE